MINKETYLLMSCWCPDRFAAQISALINSVNKCVLLKIGALVIYKGIGFIVVINIYLFYTIIVQLQNIVHFSQEQAVGSIPKVEDCVAYIVSIDYMFWWIICLKKSISVKSCEAEVAVRSRALSFTVTEPSVIILINKTRQMNVMID